VRDDHPPHSPSPCKRRPSDEPSGPPKRPALAPLIGCSLSSRAIRAIRGDSEKSISAKSDKSDKSSSAPEKHSRTRSLLHVSKPKPVRSHSARQPSTYRSPLPSPMPTIEISRAPPLETETVALPPRPRHTRAPNSAPLLARRMPSHLAPPPVPPRSPFRI
jgi:hypothetical protein